MALECLSCVLLKVFCLKFCWLAVVCCWDIFSFADKKRNTLPESVSFWLYCFWKTYALSTLPLLKQEVHTYNLLGTPFTLHLTCLIFGFHILFVFLWEWLTLWPNWTLLPQTAHFAMTAPPRNLLSLLYCKLITWLFYQIAYEIARNFFKFILVWLCLYLTEIKIDKGLCLLYYFK